MANIRTIAIGGAATIVAIGTIVYTQLDNWFDTGPTGPGSGDEVAYEEPTGPGSGDEMPAEPEGPGSGDETPADPTGPGSGDEMPVEPTGPGSGDEMPPEPEGPGSGDEVSPDEPEGPGSGDEVEPEPEGPGSGDEVDPNEPEGPGSGDEVEPEPEGPGSGDEVDPNEPTGPGSGDALPGPEPTGPGSGDEYVVLGSCNYIGFGSTCTDYIGSYWETIKADIMPCSDVGTWNEGVPCPSDYAGGCNMNGGNIYEMTIWHYFYGGDPFDPQAIQAAAGACNASPSGSWVSGG